MKHHIVQKLWLDSNNRHRYKMLTLPKHFEYMEEMNEDELKRYTCIEPLFNRNGWFYDRYTKVSWVEYEGKGYLYQRPEDFKYLLKLENSNEHRLNDNMLKALTLMISEHMFDSKRRRQYIDLMQMEQEIRYFRESHMETKKWYAQYIKDNPV